ncbi:MAG: formyltetrahydrofolate deformylase [Sulfurovum sp. PC08-66]|jgi:formyltetrahydrofolate deformylase|nr:MAG: formyltetrahydrofolate deformylase [Sulfurovum sp. PC08-66]
MKEARVLIDCPDEKGLVYKISKVFYEMGLNIDKNQEFVDEQTNKFFMRTKLSGLFEVDVLQNAIKAVVSHEAHVRVIVPAKKRIVLLATKESHALGDILIRWEAGELNAQIEAVIANHQDLKALTRRFDIPFIHVSTEGIDRHEHEKRMIEVLGELSFDYIVLAKYMRILSDDFVKRFEWKIINIHHSFLPAFIGANPYKQAYKRGVKIIGATAHFVTSDLDEGPIISQDVIAVNHNYSWQDMQSAGRDVEKIVLSRALHLVLNDRVFIHQNRTIVF